MYFDFSAIVSPSIITTFLLPAVLLGISFAIADARGMPQEVVRRLKFVSVVWAVALILYLTFFSNFRDTIPVFEFVRLNTPTELPTLFRILAVVLNIYVQMASVVMLVRFYWRPEIPLIDRLPYPIASAAILTLLLFLLNERFLRPPGLFQVNPPNWTLYLLALSSVIVTFSRAYLNSVPPATMPLESPAYWLRSVLATLGIGTNNPSNAKNASHEQAPDENQSKPPDRTQPEPTEISPAVEKPKEIEVAADTKAPANLPVVAAQGQTFHPAIPVTSVSLPPIQLKLRRSQRAGTFGKAMFALNARIELSAEGSDLVRKCRLGGVIVYDSAARKKHAEAAAAHAESTRGASNSGLWMGIARSSLSLAVAAFSLRVTIDSLISGVNIECKDLDELIAAEDAIMEACRSVKTYIDLAQTFDGREEVIGF